MTESDEQTLPLTIFSNTSKEDKIRKSFNFDNGIQTIHRLGPYGDMVLNVASCYGPKEVIQLLLTSSALKSLENISYRLPSSNESRMNEIRELFEKNRNLFHSSEDIQDIDYIEWSIIAETLLNKRQEFRLQIDLYKTYDNQHHLIKKLLIEIIDYYLNEYLIEQEGLSQNETSKLGYYFKQAIQEQNYLKYFIKAYTLTNNFHRILNKHLALYILDYFDTSSYSSSSPTKYRLINCLVHIVTLLIHHPDIQKYKYKGITYRGLLMTKNDLKSYTIGNHILNRSFLSTSKNRSVAQLFTGNNQGDQTQISVLLKYTIKQKQTAIDIEHLSTIQDEKEVLILPFAVFQVKDRIENDPQMSPPVLVEIDLEECENDEQINYKKQKSKTLNNIRYQTTKRKKVIQSKCFYGSITLLIMSSLILALVYALRDKIKFNNEEQKVSKDKCPTIVNRSVWNASDAKNYTLLTTPVPYVAIHHTRGSQCKTLDSCIPKIQRFQKLHMDNNSWDDIGYNFLVAGNGDIFEGRGWTYVGAHCKGFNTQSIGIGFIGDFVSTPLSKSSLEAAKSLIECGILFGLIQRNYTLVGHWGYGIAESYMFNLNKSRHSMRYCVSRVTTISPT